MMKWSDLLLSLMAAIGLSVTGLSIAQEFPSRPLRLVAANSPGSAVDLIARIMGPELSKSLGQPVVVENRAGAASIIGYEYVAKAAPDGYTSIIANRLELATLPLIAKDLRFDPHKDLVPIIGLSEGRLVVASASSLPWKSFAEFRNNARANPGKLNSGGSSAVVRLISEQVFREAGIKLTFIPYSNTGAYAQALLTGDLHAGITSESVAAGMGDRVRMLAITGAQRLDTMRDVPTFAEVGHPNIGGVSHSINVPLRTPKAATDKLHAAASRALQQPELRAQFAKIRQDIVEQSAEVAAKKLEEEVRIFAEVAKSTNMQLQ